MGGVERARGVLRRYGTAWARTVPCTRKSSGSCPVAAVMYPQAGGASLYLAVALHTCMRQTLRNEKVYILGHRRDI